MIPRSVEKVLPSLISGYPVITITGPRQSGKTTLSREFFASKPYVSFENPDTREEAQSDPRSFLERYRDGAVFDEVQRLPELLSYLQQIVDEGPKSCRFVLTGSQQFGLNSKITQSLAGRTALIHLLPFSYEELYSFHDKNPSMESALFTGLYPPIHDRGLDPQKWYADYVQTYIERDIRSILNVRDLSLFQLFLKMCAARCGCLINLSGIASDCGITHNTAKEWISILEAGYIVFRVVPYFNNLGKRLVKTPKLYFYDTGLATYLLGIKAPEQLAVHPHRGAIFETFIAAEIMKSAFHSAEPPSLYFWRDRSGNEIDFIIDRGSDLLPIEAKSGRTVASDWFDGLKNWRAFARDRAKQAVLIYGGDETYSREGTTVTSWRKAGQLQKQ
ncbi:MAG: ATP-binding protein [Acidobacteria bacterium]|nr:ATP-binding protein [Acidobacteriota bacterium]